MLAVEWSECSGVPLEWSGVQWSEWSGVPESIEVECSRMAIIQECICIKGHLSNITVNPQNFPKQHTWRPIN